MLDERALLMQVATNRELVDKLIGMLPVELKDSNYSSKIRFDVYGHSSNAYSLDLTSLSYYNFRENKRGTLIDLLVEFCDTDRTTLINDLYISVMLNGYNPDLEGRDFQEEEYSLKYPEVYEEECLNYFPNTVSDIFLKDNVWISTQSHWKIKYDKRSNRVVIPVYQDEELVGAIGRINIRKVDKGMNKYFPILAYSKSLVLFGFDEYRELIKKTKRVILVESEKSVLKAWQYRSKTPVLAVGGSNISRHHIERLNLLGVETVLWAQDKGIEEEEVLKNNLIRLKKFSTAKIISYLDSDNCELLDDKECVFDKEVGQIKQILKDYTKEYYRRA